MNSSEKIKANVIIKFVICRNISGYEHDAAQAKCKDDLPQKAPHPRKYAKRMRNTASLAEQQLWHNCVNKSWQFGFTVHQLQSLLALLPSAGKPMC